MATTVTIGALTLPNRPDPSGGFWFEKLIDWYKSPEAKSKLDERPQAHGSFRPVFDWRGVATPSVEGHFAGASYAEAVAAIDALNSLAGGQLTTMTVADDLRSTSRQVSIRNIDIPDNNGQPLIDFAIDMVAPDPRRYGTEVATPTGLPVPGTGIAYPITFPLAYGTPGADGRVSMQNPGTAESYPTFEVSGALVGGFSLVEVGTGRQIRFVRDIPDGSKVVINSRTGRAYIDVPANDVSSFLTVTDWWSVPAGGSSVVQFSALGSSSGTPTLLARLAPAFW